MYKPCYTESEKANCIYALLLIGTREALRAIKGYFVEPLSGQQMRLIGKMLDTFRCEDIVEEEITISNGLMRVIFYLDNHEKKILENMSMDNLTILDYDDENEYILPNGLYKKVHKLTIDGEFESIPNIK